MKNAMIIGKGSLFLGRMTNLFDGVSFVIQGNTKAEAEAAAGVPITFCGALPVPTVWRPRISRLISGFTPSAEAAAGVSEEEVKGLIAKAMKDFAASLMAE